MSVLLAFITILCQVLTIAIIIRAILSWFLLRPNNPLVVFLHQITEPILSPLRRVIPRIGFIDITPIIAIILLQLINRLLHFLLRS